MMRRFGIGTALALAGVVALVAGGIAVATRGDDTTVSQVNEEGYGPPGMGGHGRPDGRPARWLQRRHALPEAFREADPRAA